MADSIDVSNLNPEFARRMNGFLAAAAARGIPAHIISGYRNNDLQTKLYANYQARQAGRALPYPEEGSGGVAAAPGGSFHNYGLAVDVLANNPKQQSALIALGQDPAYGIHPLGSFDPPHFQMPGTLSDLRANPPTLQGQPVNLSAYVRGRQNEAPISDQPHPTATASAAPAAAGGDHAAFIRNYAQQIGLDPNLALGIAGAEGLHAWGANNPNAASRVDVSGGQPFSFGDFQLNVSNGMGTDALRAGIDPRDPSQWQAADKFALDRMKAGGVGPWKGDPVAAAYLKSGAVPPAPAVAAAPPGQGGIGSDYAATATTPGTTINTAAAPAAPAAAGSGTILPGFKTAAASSGFLQGLRQLTGSKDPSKEGQGAEQDRPPQPLQPIMGPGLRNATPMGGMLLPMAPALQNAITGYKPPPITYGQTLNSMDTPMSWGSGPPGQAPFAGGPPAGASPVGTSLSSLQQLQMMDPQRFALLYGTGAGNPYGGTS